jgi:hemerythrin-like domain-containing protein
MAQQSRLAKLAQKTNLEFNVGVVKLLLADHKLLRNYMQKVKSDRQSPQDKIKYFKLLEKTVRSHVQAEENAFLSFVEHNPKFADQATESREEHRVHEYVLKGIRGVSDRHRKIVQMESFCEILEHHLDEEEKDLFPRFKKYAALSTRKKMGKNFLKVRVKTNKVPDRKGALRFAKPLKKIPKTTAKKK